MLQLVYFGEWPFSKCYLPLSALSQKRLSPPFIPPPKTRIILSSTKNNQGAATNLILDLARDPTKFVSDILIKRVETLVCSPELYYQKIKPNEDKLIEYFELYTNNRDPDEDIFYNIFNTPTIIT